MEMGFYWVQDWCDQYQFSVQFQPLDKKFGDYFTKHNPPSHHKKMRPIYLVNTIQIIKINILLGCVNMT